MADKRTTKTGGEKLDGNYTWITRNVDYPLFAPVSNGRPDLENARTWDQLSEGEQKFSEEQGFFYGNWEKGEEPIRKLNAEEREIWGLAVGAAVRVMPYFRDSVALMSPARDRTAATLYTDKYARIGIGDLFFYKWDVNQRIFAVLHETMHVLYRHFERFEKLTANPSPLLNIAGDFEINSQLAKVRSEMDVSQGIHPEDVIDVPRDHPWAGFNGQKRWGNIDAHWSMEQNFVYLKEEDPAVECPRHGSQGQGEQGESGGSGSESGSQGESGGEQGQGGSGGQGESGEQGQNGSGSGSEGQNGPGGQGGSEGDHAHGDNGLPCSCQGWSCGEATDERGKEMDDAGIGRASDLEKELAEKNTRARVSEEKKKGMGNGTHDAFLELVEDQLRPSKVDWRIIARQIFARVANDIIAGNRDYSFRRPNRRLAQSKYIFPAMVSYQLTAMLGVDTSGSMSESDYIATLGEVEEMMKSSGVTNEGMRVFSVDTTVQNVKKVHSLHEIDFQGGGGTDMSVGFKYVNDLPMKERPDLFALATDGFVPWEPLLEELKRPEASSYRSVILVTNIQAYENRPQEIDDYTIVLDISPVD